MYAPVTTLPLTLIAVMTLAAPTGAGPRGCVGDEAIERTVYQMGTLLTVRVEGVDSECGAAAVEAALRAVARYESLLSSWTTESEIGRINAAPAGARVRVDAELVALLKEVDRWVAATGGAFDPAVGALIDAWDLRGSGRVPSAGSLAAARRLSGWAHLTLADQAIRRGPQGWWLDTGGFGKGAALRAAGEVLRSHGVGAAVLDFGGQLLVLGAGEVAVAHPARRREPAALLRVRDASVSTTSSSERFVEVAGERFGHVLDPRTGRPVAPWGSVTVVTSDALQADALSTALYVMGPDVAREWSRRRGDVAVLLLIHEGAGVRAEPNAAMSTLLIDVSAEEPAAARALFPALNTHR